MLFAIDVVITLIFGASVEAQSGAYATGVLVLILSAAFAATLALWRERRWALAFYMGLLCLVFGYTLADNCVERLDGLIIGIAFTLILIADMRAQPVHTLGGIPNSAWILRRSRELAYRAGAEGQEGAFGSHHAFDARGASQKNRRDRQALRRARAIPVPSRESAR